MEEEIEKTEEGRSRLETVAERLARTIVERSEEIMREAQDKSAQEDKEPVPMTPQERANHRLPMIRPWARIRMRKQPQM